MAKLITPLTFSTLLETWVKMTCMLCGRGENDTKCYYNSMSWKTFDDPHNERKTQRFNESLSEQQKHKEALLQAWDGAFCSNCGRGKTIVQPKTDTEMKTALEKLKSVQTKEQLFLTKDVMSPSQIYNILCMWITTPCVSCKRGALVSTMQDSNQTIQQPLSLQLLISVWTNQYCKACGLGGQCNGLSIYIDQQETQRRAVVYAKNKKKRHPKEDLLLDFLNAPVTRRPLASHDATPPKNNNIEAPSLKRKLGGLLEAYVKRGAKVKAEGEKKKQKEKKRKKKSVEQMSIKPGPRNENEMKRFYAYIVRKSFYGYEPPPRSSGLTEYSSKNLKLREFFLPEVIEYVKTAFGSQIFIDDQISSSTNLLIVPDNWDRKLPISAVMYAKNLRYLPFSFVLHPTVENKANIRSLMAPKDAKYQIMRNAPPESEQTTYFELKEVSPDDIVQNLQNWTYGTNTKRQMGAAAPSMKTTTATKKTSMIKKSLPNDNKKSVSKKTSFGLKQNKVSEHQPTRASNKTMHAKSTHHKHLPTKSTSASNQTMQAKTTHHKQLPDKKVTIKKGSQKVQVINGKTKTMKSTHKKHESDNYNMTETERKEYNAAWQALLKRANAQS